VELTLTLDEGTRPLALFGQNDRNLRLIRESLGVRIAARGDALKLSGDPEAVSRAVELIEELRGRLKGRGHLGADDVADALGRLGRRRGRRVAEELTVYARGTVIRPRSDGQRQYMAAVRTNDLVFCTGPAGTGKTYLAVAAAVHALKGEQVKRLILARPAVEAGEKLGFLPGDMLAKVNPYLRPLFDSLHDMMEFDQIRRFMENDLIEVIPLAFMRGRTFNDAFIILDEAQNTSAAQMLMVLTRMGQRSKMVLTGDVTQIDLPDPSASGMLDAWGRLRGVKGIGFCRLSERDIVRHSLVQTIVNLYERTDRGAANGPASAAGDERQQD
jgi:phosphate starvation-inducible PhoH-like protein